MAESEGSMRGIGGTACIVAAGLFLAANSQISGQKDDSTPPEKEKGHHSFPKQCQGFLTTARTRLVGVWGNHEPSHTITTSAFSADRRYALLALVPGDLE